MSEPAALEKSAQQPLPKTPQFPPLWKSALLYALFLLPTIFAGFHVGWDDAALSRAFPDVWQATFWRFPGCSPLVSRVVLDGLTVFAIAGLAWLFYRGFRTLARAPEPRTAREKLHILLWPAICGLLLIAVVPFHSSDLYGYLNRGFQQSIAQTNPYLVTVSEIPGWQANPLFHSHWIDNPCPYGFFFAHLAAWITRISGPSFFGAFLLAKALNWLALLGTTALIARLAGKLGGGRPWLSAWLFGANPLVLLHAIGNGHNDILLAFLLMAALNAMESVRWRWTALPLLALSIMTKYASLLALPFVLFGLFIKRASDSFRERAFHLTAGLLAAGLLLLLLGLPYLDFHHPWPWNALLDNAGKPQHSIIDMLAGAIAYPLKWLTGDRVEPWRKAVANALKPLFWGGFLLFYCRELARGVRHATRQASPQPGHAANVSSLPFIHAIGLVMTVMIALVSAKFHPWYPIMVLPVLLALPETSRLRQFGLTFSLFQLAGFTVFQNLPVFSPLLLTVLPLLLTWKDVFIFCTKEKLRDVSLSETAG